MLPVDTQLDDLCHFPAANRIAAVRAGAQTRDVQSMALRISLSSLLGLAFTACDAAPPVLSLRTVNADIVEYQDGDGPWQVITGQDGHYTFPVDSGRYGIVVACKAAAAQGGPRVTVDYYAVSDGADHVVDSCAPGPTTDLVNIGGALTGKRDGEMIAIDTGPIGQTTETGARWGSIARAGAGLVLATRLTDSQLPAGVVLQPATYGQDAQIDLDFRHELALTEHPIELDPAGGIAAASGYQSPAGETYTITLGAAPGVLYTLPDAARGDGLSLIGMNGGDVDRTIRSVERAFRTPPQRLDLPAKIVLADPPKRIPGDAYELISVTVPTTDNALAYLLSYRNSSATWYVTYANAWLSERGETGARFTSALPDLPALAPYALSPQEAVWSVAALTGPHTRLPGIDTPAAELIHDGDTFTRSEQSGVL
jgi:hypothetical protein